MIRRREGVRLGGLLSIQSSNSKRQGGTRMNKTSKYRNYALIAFVLLLFGTAVASTQFKVPVIMTDIMTQFDMDGSSASWLMSIFTLVGIVLAIPTGGLAKKYGPKALLLAAAVILFLGSLVGVFAQSGTMLIVSRGIEGVAFILVTICGPLAVQKYVAPEKIGSATGIWALWVCLGSVVGGVVTPTVRDVFGFVGVWMIYAIFAAIFAVLVAVVVKFNTPDGAAADEHPGGIFREGQLRRTVQAQHPSLLRNFPDLQHGSDGDAFLLAHVDAGSRH